MAEYANMVTIACVATVLFLGGWHPLFPAPYSDWVPPSVVLAAAAILLFLQGNKIGRKGDHVTFPLFGLAAFLLAAAFLRSPFCKLIWFPSSGLPPRPGSCCLFTFGFVALCRAFVSIS